MEQVQGNEVGIFRSLAFRTSHSAYILRTSEKLRPLPHRTSRLLEKFLSLWCIKKNIFFFFFFFFFQKNAARRYVYSIDSTFMESILFLSTALHDCINMNEKYIHAVFIKSKE